MIGRKFLKTFSESLYWWDKHIKVTVQIWKKLEFYPIVHVPKLPLCYQHHQQQSHPGSRGGGWGWRLLIYWASDQTLPLVILDQLTLSLSSHWWPSLYECWMNVFKTIYDSITSELCCNNKNESKTSYFNFHVRLEPFVCSRET